MKSITITQTKVRTGTRWQVRWTDAQDKVHRKFFTAKQAAETCAATLRGDRVSIDRRILSLPTDEREKMLAVWAEANRRGVDLWALLTASPQPAQASPTLEAAIADLIAAKTAAGKAADYIIVLRQACTAFARGREQQPIHQITAAHLEAYLSTFTPNNRSTVRNRLSALLSFAVRRGWIVANPCARLERQTVVRQNPQILTVPETAACLRWLSDHPRCLAWFALTALAGLRPEEAQRTEWDAINLDEGFIRVERQTSKKRQRRVVYPRPAALRWLAKAKELASTLPIPTISRKRAQKQLRALLGWPKWKKDCTRHSAASYWLAAEESAAKVAMQLGHTEGILRTHYMALVTKEEAAAYWQL